jgi:hypothetical protein
MFNVPYSLPSYIFGPKWFYGFDSVTEAIGVIICALLVFYSYRCYKFTSEKKYSYFSISFLSLMLGFISKVLGSLTIYEPSINKSPVGSAFHSAFSWITPDLINGLAFIFYIFFMTMGFMMLFLIVSKLTWKDKRVIAMLMYSVFVATWLGVVHYQLFYLTTFVMLCFITYSYFINYLELKTRNCFLVALSFGILLISHAFFVFVIYSKQFYVIAEIVQLIGFLFLLIPFIIIFIKKPKNKLIK